MTTDSREPWLSEPERAADGEAAALTATTLVNLMHVSSGDFVAMDSAESWPTEALVQCLDHHDTMVRAYAARALGDRYSDTSAEPSPSLPEFVSFLTAKEIERPGIAGPFFSNWFDFDIASFEERAEIKVDDWLLTLLKERKHPEPNTLPCSNGIDFFAHEIFGGRPDLVRKLIDLGHLALALEAAMEEERHIGKMAGLLAEIADRDDIVDSTPFEVGRRASWYLADYFQRLHPAGARRGFVAHRKVGERVELLVMLRPDPKGEHPGQHAFSALLYPSDHGFLDEAEANVCLEAILPAELRGELLPRDMPDDGSRPWFYNLASTASVRYRSGAMIHLCGELDEKRYSQIGIRWHGTPGLWRPVAFP